MKEMEEMEEREIFSLLIYNFLNSIRERKIAEEHKKEFFNFVFKLNKGTDIQKRRFFMFFDVKDNKKLENYSTIAKIENCTYPAVKYSVTRIRSILVNLKDKEREELISIIKNDNIL